MECRREDERTRYGLGLQKEKFERRNSSPQYKQYQRDYYEANREKIREREKNRVKTPERVEYLREYYLTHKADKALRVRNRRHSIKRAGFPHEREALNEFYRNCPEGHHVDHVIPLKHPLVSGLHVLANLQYLPAVQNLQKSNQWEPDWI